MPGRVSATPAVLELLERLAARYGPLVIHQSGGCCDGSSPICLPAEELPPGPADVLLGRLGQTPVYIDGDQDERWQRPELLIDVSHGAAMGFSLEGVEDMHLLAHSAEGRAQPEPVRRGSGSR
jgi:uncharacterized protein (DUF779 family)